MAQNQRPRQISGPEASVLSHPERSLVLREAFSGSEKGISYQYQDEQL